MIDMVLTPYHWFLAGMIGIILELAFCPGTFILWIGLGALGTGVVGLCVMIPVGWQIALFGGLSIVSMGCGRRWYRQHARGDTSSSVLETRRDGLIGRIAILEQPIRQGKGRLTIDGVSWMIQGPDLSEGTSVNIVGMNGNILRVLPVNSTIS